MQSFHHTIQRYRTLSTHRISALPIVVLMPHSACNCKCVMCDIWKGNGRAKQLSQADVEGLMSTLRKLETRQVLMSGGEALLNPGFFTLCAMLRKEKIRISLLSTGLLLKKKAEDLLQWVDDLTVSLDGDEETHDRIRNVAGAFRLLKAGIEKLHALDPAYPVSGRTVIQRLNFRRWPAIIEAALDMGLNRISFLPADISSQAFNREQRWDQPKQQEIMPAQEELPELEALTSKIIRLYEPLFGNHFIAESPEKIKQIHAYYAALYGANPFPVKKCNAPWVSAVVEADGTVRPCFFHEAFGNIRAHSLEDILNSREAIAFRRALDPATNDTCVKCVCSLHLPPGKDPAA
jgi:MoaA/NifB/PqqE/SkfB family radical SAM enzyme